MSVDVEDWHNATILQVSGKVVPPGRAVESNTLRLLDLFDEHGVKATWFILGEVAESYPSLVRRIVDAGHEPGVHGFHHHQVHRLSREEFREYTMRAKAAVEQAGGRTVKGYRAVDFGIDRKTWPLLDTLVEVGFVYDSSVFPFRGLRYGMGDSPMGAHWVDTRTGKRILEIPVGVARFPGLRVPATGGGYLRQFPLPFTMGIMSRIHQEGRPVVFYMHPCEIEHDSHLEYMPDEMSAGEKLAMRRLFVSQTLGRKRTEKKLRELFGRYRFSTIQDVFKVEA